MFEVLNRYKVHLAFAPVIYYLVFIIYSFIRDFSTGLSSLVLSFFGLPLTIFVQVVLYYILKLFSSNSYVPVVVLSLVALISLLTTLYKMIFFQKVKAIQINTSSINVSSNKK